MYRESSRRSWLPWCVFSATVVLVELVAAHGSAASEVVPRVDSEEQRSPQTVSDLDPDAIYREAKERGVDLLSRRTPRPLRESFVALHAAATKSGAQLISEETNAAAAAREVSDGLARTGLSSSLQVRTRLAGAQIKYRLIGSSQTLTAGQLTNATTEEVVIGLYHIWAERENKETSSPIEIFRVVRPSVVVDLAENVKK